jgi:hypothetical protein
LYIVGTSEEFCSSVCFASGWAGLVAQPSQATLWKCCSFQDSGSHWSKSYCSLENRIDRVLPPGCHFAVTGYIFTTLSLLDIALYIQCMSVFTFNSTVACRQWPWLKQLYNSHCYAVDPQTDTNATIALQQRNSFNYAVHTEML